MTTDLNRTDKLMLVADVGNTHMVFGLYDDTSLLAHWRLSSARDNTPDELAWQLHGMFVQSGYAATAVTGIMVASVVPHLDTPLAGACERICGLRPVFVGDPEVKTGMAVDYKNPREVGADRIVNAVAARERFGSPVIVMDCGTATTFDVVSAAGHYAGGLIVPGPDVALAALCLRAAKLPEVTLARTATLIGRDTATSMQAGSYWATVDALTGLIARLRSQPGYEQAPVVATGGLVPLLIGDLPCINHHLPYLTLDGLNLLADRHFSSH
ncbi:type III pantothenate kinase [Mariprofundus ferrooxydans]|uniref:Type III pantothenate kinase n=1 Tax=Mariprofundus ferrooxydans PV-1 TaxID=314345 RepID=Q0EZ25_9PROT|nr:type III pantothenate kinase [Mariprofundus ferrooxydans]EAU54599.1 putative Bordetella pertussis Bvg accessory factor family protein [Mariprofundus ferrooxydans PV-1]KON48793.1 Bvg accessory protein [Mariprofundus ferrooxydans]